MTAPDWIYNSVLKGLYKLNTACLKYRPSFENTGEVAVVVGIYADAIALRISGNQSINEQRLEAMFLRASAELNEWPSPAKLLEFLPAKPLNKQINTPHQGCPVPPICTAKLFREWGFKGFNSILSIARCRRDRGHDLTCGNIEKCDHCRRKAQRKLKHNTDFFNHN